MERWQRRSQSAGRRAGGDRQPACAKAPAGKAGDGHQATGNGTLSVSQIQNPDNYIGEKTFT